MRSTNMKFLFSFVLSIAIWSRVEAEMEVTVTRIESKVFDNPIIESWDSNLEDNGFTTTLTTKKNCPEPGQMNCEIYDETGAFTTTTQPLTFPMKDMEKYNFCETMDTPQPDDDECSMAEGTHSASGCDLTSAFENQKPGDYNCKCTFLQNNEKLGELNFDITVKEK